jgi:hypothetical protein
MCVATATVVESAILTVKSKVKHLISGTEAEVRGIRNLCPCAMHRFLTVHSLCLLSDFLVGINLEYLTVQAKCSFLWHVRRCKEFTPSCQAQSVRRPPEAPAEVCLAGPPKIGLKNAKFRGSEMLKWTERDTCHALSQALFYVTSAKM